MRRENQYLLPYSAGHNEESFFRTDLQERIYKEVIMIHEKPYVLQKFIDMINFQKKATYFAEARLIWEELGLLPIMNFTQDYDVPLVAQFYATSHFDTTRERKITWMSRNEQCSATLAEFGAILGYQD